MSTVGAGENYPNRSRAQWGPFWFFPFYCGLRRVFHTFRIPTFRPRFGIPENVLSSEGTLESRAQWGPFWFFPFYCGLRRKKTWLCFIGWDEWMDVWMGWDGISFVSSIFFHTMWVYRYGIYLLIHVIKIVTNIVMGFKIWCQVSKFDVKLGVVVKTFKIRTGTWLFFLLV